MLLRSWGSAPATRFDQRGRKAQEIWERLEYYDLAAVQKRADRKVTIKDREKW
jgi:hypothetical protein